VSDFEALFFDKLSSGELKPIIDWISHTTMQTLHWITLPLIKILENEYLIILILDFAMKVNPALAIGRFIA